MQETISMVVKRSLILLCALSLLAPALASGQSPQRGWVGVAYTTSIGQTDQNGNMIFTDYPVIESIEPGSPAEKAGLQAGDKIMALNAQDVKKNPLPIGNMLQPGRRIVFRFRRDDVTRNVTVTVAPRPAGTAERYAITLIGPAPSQVGSAGSGRREVALTAPMLGAPPPAMVPMLLPFGPSSLGVAGAELTRLNERLQELVGLKTGGVFVVNVAPGSPAMRAGLQSTDVIIKAGDFSIDNPGEIAQLMNGVNTIKLQIIRKKKPHIVTLRW
jgi:serine protease Do